MEPYTEIATVYDSLLRHVDYQEWYEYILSVMNRYMGQPRAILELGCGTGRFGSKFSNNGYTIFGMDKSLDMLRVAKTRAFFNFRILCGDITNFYINRKMDFIFSVHDTVNYLLEDADILNMFKCVREIMHKDSVFMFDITTEYNIYEHFHEKTSQYHFKNSTVEWSNIYESDTKLIRSTMNIFRAGKTITEEHLQRIYSCEEMKALVSRASLVTTGIFGDYTFDTPAPDTIMINFITRKA